MSTSSQDVICIFKEQAPLRDFLQRKNHRLLLRGDQLRYHEIQSALSQIIEEEKLFDATNPAIVLCDEALEKALDVKAFHISELKHYLSKQFQYIKCETSSVGLEEEQESDRNDSKDSSFRAAPLEEAEGLSSGTSSSQMGTPPSHGNQKVEGSFIISQELRETFNSLPEFKKDQVFFEYNEILSYLSKYIIQNRDKFFDPKNVRVAFIENDPLEKAFKVKTFHRIQVTALLDREINRVPSISEIKVEDLTSKNDISGSGERKRPMDEPSGSSSSPKRIRRLSTYTVSVLGYDSTDEETIYSAQGYETVAMSEKGQSEMSNDDEEEEISSDDEDAMVYSAEYEINDDDEDEMDRNRSQKDTESSDEDSELEDVVLKVTVFDLMEEENEFWADSESDIDEELELSESKSDFKCCRCGERSQVILLYCKGCWEQRKESFPQRENPRKKRRTLKLGVSEDLTQSEKERCEAHSQKRPGIPSYLRSTSHSSSTSSLGPHHYESQDSGVGSQDSIFSEKSLDVSSEDNDSEGIYSPLKRGFTNPTPGSSSEGCSFCFRRPKNATLIHGNIGHTICCYPCAKKLWKDQRPCPICRRKIEKFVLNIEA